MEKNKFNDLGLPLSLACIILEIHFIHFIVWTSVARDRGENVSKIVSLYSSPFRGSQDKFHKRLENIWQGVRLSQIMYREVRETLQFGLQEHFR